MTKHKRSDVFDNPIHEGADADPNAPAAKATPRHEGTINELMAGWWKACKDLTLQPESVGDHFVAYAAERGWALVDADTLPPPPEADPIP